MAEIAKIPLAKGRRQAEHKGHRYQDKVNFRHGNRLGSCGDHHTEWRHVTLRRRSRHLSTRLAQAQQGRLSATARRWPDGSDRRHLRRPSGKGLHQLPPRLLGQRAVILPNGETKHLDHTIWLTPRYARDTNPFGWPIEAYNLAALDPDHAHPTLLLYTFGDLSKHVCAIAHDNPDKEEQYAKLDAYFRPYYSLLPNFDPDSADCRPKGYLASQMRYDEFAGYGSYSNMQVGIEDADKHVVRLQAGLPGARYLLCGRTVSRPLRRGGLCAARGSLGNSPLRRLLRNSGFWQTR